MLGFNLLILGVAVTTVSSRSIGGLLQTIHLPHLAASLSKSTSTSPIPLDFLPPPKQCVFTPHQPAQRTQSPTTIPTHAWPHIASLLSEHFSLFAPVENLASPSARPPTQNKSKNAVQTIHLASAVDDATLEGVELGLVFVKEEGREGKELRDLNDERDGEGCVEQAVKQVVEGQMMEGVLQISGGRGGGRGGRLGFLVYRVD